MKNFFYLLLTSSVMSCTTMYRGGDAAIPKHLLEVTPVFADLEIDTSRVLQGSSTTITYLKIFKISDNNFSEAFNPYTVSGASIEIKAATYKALAGSNCDIIVNPKYNVEIKKGVFQKKTTAIVSGYGGKIKINKKKNIFK